MANLETGKHVTKFMSPSHYSLCRQDRMADCELNLMDIDAEQLDISDVDYSATCVLIL